MLTIWLQIFEIASKLWLSAWAESREKHTGKKKMVQKKYCPFDIFHFNMVISKTYQKRDMKVL